MMKIIIIPFLVICIGFVFYDLLFHDDVAKKRKKKYQQDFGGDCAGGVIPRRTGLLGVPDINFANDMREIVKKECPDLLKNLNNPKKEEIEMSVAVERMKQMGEGIL